MTREEILKTHNLKELSFTSVGLFILKRTIYGSQNSPFASTVLHQVGLLSHA